MNQRILSWIRQALVEESIGSDISLYQLCKNADMNFNYFKDFLCGRKKGISPIRVKTLLEKNLTFC